MGGGRIKRQAKSENAYGDKMFLSEDQHCSQEQTAKYLGSSFGCFQDNEAKRPCLLMTHLSLVGFRCPLFILARKNLFKESHQVVSKAPIPLAC